MTDQQRQDIETRAATIVRGLTDPNSGWYNSPDDLQRVIGEHLEAVWMMRTRRLQKAIRLANKMRGFVKGYGLEDNGPESEWERFMEVQREIDAMVDEES